SVSVGRDHDVLGRRDAGARHERGKPDQSDSNDPRTHRSSLAIVVGGSRFYPRRPSQQPGSRRATISRVFLLQKSSGSLQMRRYAFLFVAMSVLVTTAGLAFQAQSDGPYKVLKTARVGGEGGTDYIFADPVGRRLYITRRATQAHPATDSRAEVPAFEKRLTIFDLDPLAPVGTIPGVGGNGATVCPNTGHGFTSDHPQPSMFDVKTMKLIKTIEVPAGFSADGIYCDTSNNRVYIGSHPTKTLIVVDAKDGAVLGNIDLGGTPEQTVSDGKGTVYQVLQDRRGGVAVIDAKAMKVTAKYPFGDNGACNGLAID